VTYNFLYKADRLIGSYIRSWERPSDLPRVIEMLCLFASGACKYLFLPYFVSLHVSIEKPDTKKKCFYILIEWFQDEIYMFIPVYTNTLFVKL